MQKIFFKLVSFVIVSLSVLFLTPNLSYSYGNLTGWTHYGIRPLGMGNAFVSIADDYNAIFYNPAGIGLKDHFGLQLLNVNVAISKNFVDLVKDIKDANDSKNENKENDQEDGKGENQALLDVVDQHLGQANMLNISMTPYLRIYNFEMAVGLDAGASIVVKRDPAVKVVGGARGIVPVGYAMNFFDGKLRVGTALKFVYQAIVDDEIGMADIQDLKVKTLKDDYLRLSAGVGVDLGVLLTQPDAKFKPSLGISISNIGSIKNLRKDKDVVVVAEPSVNTGISFKLFQNKILNITLASDVHSINQNIDFSKKFGAGVELDLYSLLRLQAGIYQGYYTAGINFDLFLLNIRAATYAEEAGDYAGSIENRVYMLELKLII